MPFVIVLEYEIFRYEYVQGYSDLHTGIYKIFLTEINDDLNGHTDKHCSSAERLELTYKCSVFLVKIPIGV